MQPFITAKQAEIVELCRTHHVRRLSIFGSAEFQPDALDDYVRNLRSLHDALVDIFGRKVNMITGDRIANRYFRKEIEDSQVTLYAA